MLINMQIHPSDTVEVRTDGQKYALCDISVGERVIKYGFPIGMATVAIAKGEQVGPHNLKTALSGLGDWHYDPTPTAYIPAIEGSFMGYSRADGSVGIRNELWIIPTVGCINHVVRQLAEQSGGRGLTHPYGCSQLGGDLLTTQRILCGLIRHPNAGGVLVLGLGCENNGLSALRAVLGDTYDPKRVRFLNLQDCEDEMAEGMRLIGELKEVMARDARLPQPLSKLRIAVKCGGSDGYSGITANPLVGRVSERFYAAGASVLMSEIPEVFGAEQLLLSRAVSREVFDRAAGMIRAFRGYFIDHGESIAENPSPGNVAGGITTLEEKSLGCVQKAGCVPLCGALEFGQQPQDGAGLYLVNGPGNDLIAITNLAASGAHIILFTTGRGTPLCAPVPTLKIATNSALFRKKPHWMDLDAGTLMDGASMEALADRLFALCLATAEGQPSVGERAGSCDIAIFKDGVTL
ncbi:MAG: UxaA family hydrolase [Clostridia bacterium]|nr:UxaA family hydrolase [Clostridia bacterium]